MFKEKPEGQTHYHNDNCGEKEHNTMPDKNKYIKEFEEKLRSSHEKLGLLLNSELAFPRKGETAGTMKERIIPHILDELRKTISAHGAEVRKEIEDSKNSAYKERDMLVCALSKMFPAYLARHSEEDKEWEDDWRWIVYIDLPTGQVSWHIHDSERDWFNHLEVKENNWDGHNTERKYQRLQALALIENKDN